MNIERPLLIACGAESLVGVLHETTAPPNTGLVVVVGGPQYRTGSHRQFTQLARYLANEGIAVLRFDCRGMGDSSGEFPGFEHIATDIAAAVDTLYTTLPSLQQVALWGLCDGASAVLMYPRADRRITARVIVNPWVRSEQTLARTYVKHYYLQRLLQGDFWRKLFSGRLAAGRALGDLAGNLRSGARQPTQAEHFIVAMRRGLAEFEGPVLVVLSGNDLVAAEFRGVATEPQWAQALAREGVTLHRLDESDHTFSRAVWSQEVSRVTASWLRRLTAPADDPESRQ